MRSFHRCSDGGWWVSAGTIIVLLAATCSIHAQTPAANSTESATAYLEGGVVATRRGKWEEAQSKLEEALRLAPNDAFRITVYEKLAPVYGRLPTIDKLVDAHEFIIDHAPDPATQQQAIDDFFRAILNYVRQGSGGGSWERGAPMWVVWQNVKVPVSTATVITTRYRAKAKANPNDEPTLRVLANVFRYISPDDALRLTVLERLRGIVKKRGAELPNEHLLDLASLYVSGNQPAQGAKIYEQLIRANSDNSTGNLQFDLAVAWKNAGEQSKAIAALSKAVPQFERRTDIGDSLVQFNLLRCGDLFVELDAHDRAIPLYQKALQLADRGTDTARIQEKLRVAYEQSGMSGDTQPANDPLLDDKRQFRIEAERLEQDKGYSPDSKASNLIAAAENWIQAGEPSKAAAAARRAVPLAKRIDDDYARAMLHAKLAEIFDQLDDKSMAIEQTKEALAHADEERQIAEYQQHLAALLDDVNESDISRAASQEMLDEAYKYRSMAKRLESQRDVDDATAIENLIKAAEYWTKASDAKQARRAAQLADNKLDRVASSESFFRAEDLRSQLADLFVKLGDPQSAVDQLELAIAATDRDHEAKRLQERLAELCSQHSLPVPELDESEARKLDPLNRFRNRAEEAENFAREHESGRIRHWVDAAKNWLDAEEIDRAKAAAKRAAAEARKRRSGATANDFEKIAELYEDLGDTAAAKRFYKLAIANTSSTYKKKDYEKAIADLESLKDEED